MTDPATAVKQSVANLVSVVGDFALLFIQVVELAADEILAAIPKLFGAVRDLLNQDISIFGISDLWKVISKSPLTTLDLISLMVALPATIVMKAKNEFPNVSSSAGGATVLGDTWIWYEAAVIHTMITAVQDFLGEQANAALGWVQLGLTAALCAFTAPNSGQEFTHPGQYMGWIVSLGGFLLQASALIKRAATPKGEPGVIQQLVPIGTIFCGVISMVVALGSFTSDNKTDLILILPSFPMMAKPMKLGQSATPSTGVLAGIDIAFGYTQIGLKTSTWAQN